MQTTILLPDPKLAATVRSVLQRWDDQDIGRRIWDKDHTVWSSDPTELADRLGWLDLPQESVGMVDEVLAFAQEVQEAQTHHVVLLGMGGSSLAPEVFGETFGGRNGHPQLIVLDTTHPHAVRVVDNAVDPSRTLFVVSSKSGTTLETLSLYRTFWDRVTAIAPRPGDHFVAITDPGSALEELALERGFRRVFRAPTDVGGRYSALCAFGLVPAALIGADVMGLLSSAAAIATASSGAVAASRNPCLELGVTLGVLADAGLDKLTFICSPQIASFPAWIEQLVAESTGKDGKGIVPIDGEATISREFYGHDRVFVGLALADDGAAEIHGRLDALAAAGHPVVSTLLEQKNDLGAEMFRWELATAAAGAVLGVNPFDQPDVQLAKTLAKEAMASSGSERIESGDEGVDVRDSDALARGMKQWATANPGDYIGIQAYVAPSSQNENELQTIRAMLGSKLGLASTLGFGPRFLHSTGQLHKGGANNGLFLQLVDLPGLDISVPETDFTFGQLIAAQGIGDWRALAQRGRRVLRVKLGADAGAGLRKFKDTVEDLEI